MRRKKMETKDNGTKAKGTDFGYCNPENFKEMFEKMNKFCPGQGDSPDFSAMKGAMMKNMMEMCCKPIATDTKGNADSQNE
jgi:hypothetical protein